VDIYSNITRVIGSSDMTPTAQKDVGKKQESDIVLSDAPETQETEGQPTTRAHQVKAKALQASMDHEEKLMAIAGGTEREDTEGGETVTLPLGSKNVTLRGVDTMDLAYTRRPDAEHDEMRKQFNSKWRKNFVKDLAKDPAKEETLRGAGLNDTDFNLMAAGKVPPGFQVHHKIPIDDSGQNEMSNFVLIRNEPAHKALTNLQMQETEGIQEGETRHINWVVPRGYVYPPDPSMVTTAPR
jgi:hypothetical protein